MKISTFIFLLSFTPFVALAQMLQVEQQTIERYLPGTWVCDFTTDIDGTSASGRSEDTYISNGRFNSVAEFKFQLSGEKATTTYLATGAGTWALDGNQFTTTATFTMHQQSSNSAQQRPEDAAPLELPEIIDVVEIVEINESKFIMKNQPDGSLTECSRKIE
ncbi:hypothetical protein [Rheinheimera sp. MM224]|uniref:hypothetical protein n=1 Tax=Rheinheimera sp. MM224 TaxID=3019969 RepID=UPI0021F916B1|nr:hypothetical protein [Rheinheimera sp. MM224]CAI3795294.1 hypothetical protein JAMGFMIE_01282 [Rheinheimera sp. MM224]